VELLHLRVQNFRNLASVDIQLGRRFNVITGANGQGKTNLVEAIFLLGTVKTFRAQKNRELVRWGTELAVVEGLVERRDDERVARVEVSTQSKSVFLGDMPVARLSDFFGTLNVVVFTPDDLFLVKGGPGERRRFLDRAIFNLRSSYAGDAVRYDQLLKQRNAHLRTPKLDPVLLDIYDEQLSLLGARVAEARKNFVAVFGPRLSEVFGQIFGALSVEARYDAPWWQQDDARLSLQAALARTREDDQRRGSTSAGPHRDDLRLDLDGKPARVFASQGQQRAMVLAMKIAEVRLFEAEKGFRPILLLDDVSSELDKDRSRFLFEHLIAHPGQVFVTTTHRDHIPLWEDVCEYGVSDGAVNVAEAR
jgi:DNA replication and repair protein RecF